MDANGVEVEQSVTVSSGRIIVVNLELLDEDLADYLGEFPEPMRVDVVKRALKIGLLALKGVPLVEKVDYVEKEFGKLDRKLAKALGDFVRKVEEKLDKVFSEDGGLMKIALEKYLGTGGKLEDLFDPERKDSAVSKISSIFEEHFKGRDSVLYKLLDHADPESPIAALWRDLVEDYLKDMRNRIVGEELVEAEREKGTAKGRSYQEIVFERVNEICNPFQDIPYYVADKTGNLPGKKVGDIVVEINPSYTGGAPLRFVIEAKDRLGYSTDKIREELDEAKENRDACVALAVFTSDTCPSGCSPLQQYGGDKLICSYDSGEQNSLALNLAYRACRIEALRKLHGPLVLMNIPELVALVKQCLEKLRTIASIKAKVTKLSNEVIGDLDTLRAELESLLQQLDNGIQQAATS